MPNFCASYGCSNNSSKVECKEKKISFHRFPVKNSVLLSTWMIKMKREYYVPTEHSRICSDHFEKDCFVYQKDKRILKSDAIPTLFSFRPEKSRRPKTSYEFG